jgi:glutaconate CoA-transferase subunit B
MPQSGGPEWVITSRCTFDFNTEAGRIRVRSIQPGVTPATLQAATGFDQGLTWNRSGPVS